MTGYPHLPSIIGKMYGAKDTTGSLKQDPSFPSNVMYLSEARLPYQLNQDPNTLYHEAGVRFLQHIFIGIPG